MPNTYERVDPNWVVGDNGVRYWMPLEAVGQGGGESVIEMPPENVYPEIQMPPEEVGGGIQMPPEYVDGSGGPVPLNQQPGSFTLAPNFNGPAPGPGMPQGGLGTPMSPEEVVRRTEAAAPQLPRVPREEVPEGQRPQPVQPPGRPARPAAQQAAYPRTREELAARQEDQYGAFEDAADAKLSYDNQVSQVEAESAMRLARASQTFAEQQGAEYAAASERAWGRWTEWKTKYDEAAQAQVNPERYWKDRSGFQKSVWLLSVAAGAWGSSGPGGNGRNPALEMLQANITRDIAAQESNRDFKMRAVEGERGFISEQNRMERETLADKATAFNLRVDSLIKMADARVKALGPSANTASWLRTKAELEQMKVQNATVLFQDLKKDEDARAQRRFAAGQAASQREFTRLENEKDRQHQRDMAQVKIDAEVAKAAKTGEQEVKTRLVHPSTGVRAINRKDKSIILEGGVARDEKDAIKGMSAAALAGNRKYTALTRLLAATESADFADVFRGGTADQKALSKSLAVASARVQQPGGVLTDQDVRDGLVMAIGQEGVGLWANIKTPGELQDAIKRALAGTELETKAAMVEFADPDWDVDWKPQLLYPKGGTEPKDASFEEYRAEARGSADPRPTGRRNPEAQGLDDEDPRSVGQYWVEKMSNNLPRLPAEQENKVQRLTAPLPSFSVAQLDTVYDEVWRNKDLPQEVKERTLIEIRLERAKKVREEAENQAYATSPKASQGIEQALQRTRDYYSNPRGE
jgi:hypothetical protein